MPRLPAMCGNALGIGSEVAENYAIVVAGSAESWRIRAIGQLARAAFREFIAIPDIRVRCKQIGEAMGEAARVRAKELAS